jgi:hypothetical protein
MLPAIVRVVELSKACGSFSVYRIAGAVTVGTLEKRGVAAHALFGGIVDDSQHNFGVQPDVQGPVFLAEAGKVE